MMCFYWLKTSLTILWEDGVEDFLNFCFEVLVSTGAIIMGLGFLYVDILIFPIEIILLIMWWVYIKFFQRGDKK